MARNKNLRFDFSKAEDVFGRVARNFATATERDFDQELAAGASRIESELDRTWPRDTGYSIGRFKLSKIQRGHYRLTNDAPYSNVIEFGGYPGVGPKTVRVGAVQLAPGVRINAGIYPKQKPAAPVRRAMARERREITPRLARIIARNWRA